jgi:CheY-like chemotaxis protein
MEKNIQFFSNIDGSIPDNLIGDEKRLRQILINLLSNAAKYTEKGNISMSVITEKRRVSDQGSAQIWLRISVSDTGIGIKPEDKKKLFSDFIQVDTKRNRNIEGTGLGLAITKRLCVAMGGDISVTSEYGSGSTFTIIIPQGIESETPIGIANVPVKFAQKYETSFTVPNAKILLVDDIDANLKVAAGLLAPYKAKVDTACSGVEALQKIRAMSETQYDLVFMDHMMPGMDGIECTGLIRKWETAQSKSNRIPIVALTASAMSGAKEMYLEKGFDDYLSKPIELRVLDEILKNWLKKNEKSETEEK